MWSGIVEAVSAVLAAAERRPELADGPLSGLVGLLTDAYLSDPDLIDGADDRRWADLLEVYELSAPERFALALAFAAATDINVAGACSLLQGSAGTEPVTVALTAELAGLDPRGPDRALLSASGTLIGEGLLESTEDPLLLARRLWMPEPVVAHLTRQRRPDPPGGVRLLDPVPIDFRDTGRMVELLRAGTPVIYVHDDPRGAGINLAVGALVHADLPYSAVETGAGLSADTALNLLRHSTLAREVLVLRWTPREADDESAPVLSVLARARVPVVWVCGLPYSPGRLPWLPAVVDAEPFSPAGRETLWQQEFPGLTGHAGWPSFPLAPDEVVRVADAARREAAARGGSVTAAHLQAGTDIAAATFRPLAGTRRLTPAVRLDQLTLAPATRDRLDAIVSWTRQRTAVLDEHPALSTGGRLPGVATLFTGPPGTGKTMAAQAVAGELGYDLLTVDLSAVIDKYIGETEKKLEKIFAAAESINSVLFFDEADALFGSRSQVSDARDKYANQETAWLLQRMETFGGLAVLATNLRANLDRAFTRRLNFVVPFDPPDARLRLVLWQRFLSGLTGWDTADEPDLALLATHADLTAGDIRNIVLSALHAAKRCGEPMGMRHLRSATATEFDKLGRRLPAPLVPQEVLT